MSRVINIRGNTIIQNIQLAKESIRELRLNVEIKNNQFIFNKYDALDQINEKQKTQEIKQIEALYKHKFNIYLQEVAEEERLKIEEEKRILREEKADILIANAKKQGYKLKKEIRENNTIKLVVQKRVY